MNKYKKINFLTLFLVFSVVYMSINATLNITKCICYRIKLAQLHELNNESESKHKMLKSEIEGYSSHKKYEEFARNYLGYAEPDEIRVNIIPQDKQKEYKHQF